MCMDRFVGLVSIIQTEISKKDELHNSKCNVVSNTHHEDTLVVSVEKLEILCMVWHVITT